MAPERSESVRSHQLDSYLYKSASRECRRLLCADLMFGRKRHEQRDLNHGEPVRTDNLDEPS